jgi:tetratricopeptide (TPR) repeat protein
MKPPKQSPAANGRILARLTEALTYHQRGRLDEARAIYQSVVDVEPLNFDAVHMLGAVIAQQGNHSIAVKYFTKAIAINPNNADCHSNMAVSLNALGQLEAALASLERTIRCAPNVADTHWRAGNLCCRLKQFDLALPHLDRAIALNPNHARAFASRGSALRELGQVGAAVASFDHAIELMPDYAEAHFNRGNALREMGSFDAALGSYDRAIALRPNYVSAYCNRGAVLLQQKLYVAAIASLEKAIELDASSFDALCNRGSAQHQLAQFDAALASFDAAIRLRPDHADSHSNRAMTLCQVGKIELAIASCETAIRLKPGLAEAHSNLGNALRHANQLEKAVSSYDRAIAINPEYAEALYNRGIVLVELRQVARGIADYDRAIAIQPAYAEAHWNKGLSYLLTGDFANGWRLYEWRWEKEKERVLRPKFAQPQWSGEESLTGKTVFLHSEQGIGDTIQFIRYADLVVTRGAKVIAQIPKELISLTDGFLRVAQWIAPGEPLPHFDFHCPLLSLPLAFKTTLATIPHPTAYLAAEPSAVKKWAIKLGPRRRCRVGIVWRGRAEHQNDHNRSMSLAQLIQQLPSRFDYVSLQKDISDEDRAVLGAKENLRHFGDEIGDFSDTAALCALMDVVISVDTSVAHLSGALGRPTLILLPFFPDWRWMFDRDDSPWYSSVKLYRQTRERDWAPVLQRVSEDLSQRPSDDVADEV